jgi:hypothetical protein
MDLENYMFFKKKPDSIESLMKKCNSGYSEFLGHLTKAHSHSYFQFKCALKDDFKYLMNEISQSENEEVTMKLLQHFKGQLDFITKNPFTSNQDKFDKFLADNYPYADKIDGIKAEVNKLKMKM